MILTRFIRGLIFKPEAVPNAPTVLAGVQFQVTQVTAADGLMLEGLISDPSLSSRATLLFLHGNGGCAATRAPLVAPFASLGYRVIVADYRGYGANPGIPSRDGLRQDCAAWRDYALAAAQGPLLVVGHSLGGALAIDLLSKRGDGVAGLLTLGSLAALGMVVPEPIARLTSDNFDARDAAAAVRLPWMIVHQTDDDVVPFRHSKALFERAKGNANVRFIELTGGTHMLDWQILAPLLDQLLDLSRGRAA